ncbi:MAG: hypothetical protein JWP42_3048 [Pseudomonas sp.]|nr:hypothetical protein [Pseudomonas sp.]
MSMPGTYHSDRPQKYPPIEGDHNKWISVVQE